MLAACSQTNIKAKKKGIEGILDPFASGLLIVATERATRYIRFFSSLPRTYQAKLRLGILTDSLDVMGKITHVDKIPALSEERILKAFKKLTGDVWQTPPIFSNVKVKGVPARKLALANKKPVLKPKKVSILKPRLISFDHENIKFSVEVSSGTYIRSLGLDISRELGTVGHLTELQRTAVGKFHIKDIYESPLMKTDNADKLIPVKKCSINETLYWFDELLLSESDIKKLQNGRQVYYESQSKACDKIYKITDTKNKFYGLATLREKLLTPLKIIV